MWFGFFKTDCEFRGVYVFKYAADPSTRYDGTESSYVRFYENTEEQDYRCRIVGRKRRNKKVGQTLKSSFFNGFKIDLNRVVYVKYKSSRIDFNLFYDKSIK